MLLLDESLGASLMLKRHKIVAHAKQALVFKESSACFIKNVRLFCSKYTQLFWQLSLDFYSTVTDLAKLRGMSTAQSLLTAI